VGFYGNTGEKSIAENSPAGNDFLSQVCAVWEEESSKVEQLGIRRVSVRTGIVLSTQDGALKKLLLPFKLFAGGPLGNGKQWFPWIHIDDEVDIFLHAIDNNNLTGAVNAVSPGHLRMKEFASILGGILKRPSLFCVPSFVLKIVLGEAAESILYSQKIKPEKLLNTRFKFKFSSPTEALSDLIKNKK
nr:TIGR01777 family oxidoreductase [Ignavibacteriaceae bacterium]